MPYGYYPGFSYALTEESALHHLLHLQLPDSADLFELADTCAAYVSVLVETDDAVTFATLCKQLLAALKRMRERCDSELPPYLVEQLIAGKRSPPAYRTAGRIRRCRWIMLWR